MQLSLHDAGWVCAWLPMALPWADSSWAFSPTTTIEFKPVRLGVAFP